eukprot:TRINITY_DN12343_c0_g1_i2.p1 TRINITY_DN12343_c0_g1~~TRINITY_DN12343_c0_g1_i2.p1  ORF type:complete len:155 (-),score=35.90 TRINITY_DN12343_c0_g1_i2:152-616(-)
MNDTDPHDESNSAVSRIKSSLNSMFHAMLYEVNVALWQAILMLILEYTQSLYFLFYRSNSFSWEFDSVESAIRLVSKIALVWPYLAEKSPAIYHVVFHICGAVLILTLSIFIFFIVIKVKKKSLLRATVLWILGIFICLLQTVLYMPLMSTAPH